MDKSTKYWFKRRRYGYGFIPVTWQGWAVVAGYVVIVLALIPAFLDAPEEVAAREAGFFGIFMAAATVGLILISVSKGPRPRWRWGRKPGDDPEEDF
ncbi:MAG TPA: hypothetical protein VEU28_06740 [Actinomycetota bacterium]|nr:hypothetical protein [Actinomycetota bacterium]